MAELQITDGEGNEHRLELQDRPVTFGRSDDCDFTMVEKRASRTHCAFIPVAKGWRVVDNQSSNGTWLGGSPIVSARLQHGDEVEIGHTVISFEDTPDDTPKPARRRRRRKVPWGALIVPVVLGGGAYAALGAIGSKALVEAERSWTKAARTEIERAGLASTAEARNTVLDELLASLDGPGTAAAVRLAKAAREQPFEGARGGGEPAGGAGWKNALEKYNAQSVVLTAEQRVQRLAQLLSRYAGEKHAAASLQLLLMGEVSDLDHRAAEDLRRVEREADTAVSEGRVGHALDLWNGWLLRAGAIEKKEERELAETLEVLLEQARDAADAAVARYEKLVEDGKTDAAEKLARSAVARLRGTGYDQLVSVLTSLDGGETTTVVTASTGRSSEAVGRRETTLFLHAQTSSDELTRLRRFTEAAARLETAAGTITDPTLRSELTTRAEDLRSESAALAKLLGQVRQDPKRFGRVEVEGGAWRVEGASAEGLLLARGGGKTPREHVVANLAGDVFTSLFEKAELGDSDLVPAALLLRDLDDPVGYTRFMRRALVVESLQMTASAVHARVLGQRTPPAGGYVPHPEQERIITLDQANELKNAEKIAAYRKQLEKLVAKIEASRPAKSIAKVRAAYAKLEAARNHALELIFDTEKYFYPYRGREAEYRPVSREVDDRVLLVREEWDAAAKSTPKRDKDLDKIIGAAEDLQIEVEYLGGDCDDLMGRAKRVIQYLDQGTLTVRTFWVTDADREMLAYNDEVLQANRDRPTIATKPEQRQVEITNEYRILFGHRRAVRINDKLTEAARGHSEDMSKLGFFAHESPVAGKRSPSDRIKLTGYDFMGCSENIHAGSGSPQGAHDGWQSSSGHHRNLLNPAWTEMGTGQYGRHWTQNFAFTASDME